MKTILFTLGVGFVMSAPSVAAPYKSTKECSFYDRYQIPAKKLAEARRSGKASADYNRKSVCRSKGKGKFTKRKSRHD